MTKMLVISLKSNFNFINISIFSSHCKVNTMRDHYTDKWLMLFREIITV